MGTIVVLLLLCYGWFNIYLLLKAVLTPAYLDPTESSVSPVADLP